MPLLLLSLVKSPVPWTLTSERISCATAVVETVNTRPMTVSSLVSLHAK